MVEFFKVRPASHKIYLRSLPLSFLKSAPYPVGAENWNSHFVRLAERKWIWENKENYSKADLRICCFELTRGAVPLSFRHGILHVYSSRLPRLTLSSMEYPALR